MMPHLRDQVERWQNTNFAKSVRRAVRHIMRDDDRSEPSASGAARDAAAVPPSLAADSPLAAASSAGSAPSSASSCPRAKSPPIFASGRGAGVSGAARCSRHSCTTRSAASTSSRPGGHRLSRRAAGRRARTIRPRRRDRAQPHPHVPLVGGRQRRRLVFSRPHQRSRARSRHDCLRRGGRRAGAAPEASRAPADARRAAPRRPGAVKRPRRPRGPRQHPPVPCAHRRADGGHPGRYSRRARRRRIRRGLALREPVRPPLLRRARVGAGRASRPRRGRGAARPESWRRSAKTRSERRSRSTRSSISNTGGRRPSAPVNDCWTPRCREADGATRRCSNTAAARRPALPPWRWPRSRARA